MNSSEKKLIQEFFASTFKLLDAGIVRSDKILGDLGEWICTKQYDLKLASSGRNPGFDGYIGKKKVQVKVHNSPKGTNMSAGNPAKYDELIVLIGPRSKLRIGSVSDSFHVYRFTAKEVNEKMKRDSGHYCAKGILENKTYETINY